MDTRKCVFFWNGNRINTTGIELNCIVKLYCHLYNTVVILKALEALALPAQPLPKEGKNSKQTLLINNMTTAFKKAKISKLVNTKIDSESNDNKMKNGNKKKA